MNVAGDINGDDVVNMSDALLLFAHVSGQKDLSESELENADVVEDGVINVKDALKLYQFASGMISAL